MTTQTRTRRVQVVESPPEDDSGGSLERAESRGLGIHPVIYVALAILLLTLTAPLFSDAHRLKLFAVAGAGVLAGLALAAIAGSIAYCASGKSKRSMNMGIAGGLLSAAAVTIVAAVMASQKFTAHDEAEATFAIDQVAAIVTMQGQREVEQSASARWKYAGDTPQILAAKLRSEHDGRLVAVMVRACEPALQELAALCATHSQAVTALHSGGGLTPKGLKTKADCDTRLTELKALEQASSAELAALRGFAERIRMDMGSAGLDQATQNRLVYKVQHEEHLNAAMTLRLWDVEYVKHATAYVNFLRMHSGKWSVITKKEMETIYFGQGINVGEYNRLQRLVHDVYEREVALQERTIKVAIKGGDLRTGGAHARASPPGGASRDSNASLGR